MNTAHGWYAPPHYLLLLFNAARCLYSSHNPANYSQGRESQGYEIYRRASAVCWVGFLFLSTYMKAGTHASPFLHLPPP